MNGFGKLFLLALVSMAYLMSRAMVAKAEMEDWEELLGAVGEHIDTDQLIALIPRGLEMIDKIVQGGEHIDTDQLIALIPRGLEMIDKIVQGGEHIDTDQLSALLQRGEEMINQMKQAPDHVLTKRNVPLGTLIAPLLAILNKDYVINLIKPLLGEKNFKKFESRINMIVDLLLSQIKMLAKMPENGVNTMAPSTSTVGSRAGSEL